MAARISKIEDILKRISMHQNFIAGEPRFETSLAPMSRNDKVTFGLSKSMRVIEVGPSHNPIVSKKDGWNAYILDHLSQEGLIEKYNNDVNCDVSRIEPVDFVWKGEKLEDLIPPHMRGSFDACISSHSIEHTPDFVGFFKAMSIILSPSGLICMAIPDKRYCFDYFRPHSTTGQVIEAHVQGRKKHNLAALIDANFYYCTNDGSGAWGQQPVADIALGSGGNIDAIYPSLMAGYDNGYVDVHGWQFTPASFALVILELQSIGLIDFEIVRIWDASGCEFTVQLRRSSLKPSPAEMQAKRKSLLQAIVEELGIQADLQRAGQRLSIKL
jgi:hypothetical protein